MRASRRALLAPCAALVSLSMAQDVVYVTDLTIFTLLVRALYPVLPLTYPTSSFSHSAPAPNRESC